MGTIFTLTFISKTDDSAFAGVGKNYLKIFMDKAPQIIKEFI
jgi:hypothetical protein